MPRKSTVSSSEIYDLYWNKGKSTVEISKIVGLNRCTVFYHLTKFDKPLRDRIRMVSESSRKRKIYERLPFSGDPLERQYLLGLAEDLSIEQRSKWLIIASLTTSNQSMIEVFKKTFSKYGRILQYAISNTPYQRIMAYLDSTFSFELNDQRDYNVASLTRDELLYRLAGLIDAEGSIIITKSNVNYINRYLAIGIENEELIKQLANKLKEEFGIKAKVYKIRKKGDISSLRGKVLRYTKDLWSLMVHRKEDLWTLLPILPLLNNEKIKRRELLLKTLHLIKWEEMKDYVSSSFNIS
jgi:hypothetical protein